MNIEERCAWHEGVAGELPVNCPRPPIWRGLFVVAGSFMIALSMCEEHFRAYVILLEMKARAEAIPQPVVTSVATDQPYTLEHGWPPRPMDLAEIVRETTGAISHQTCGKCGGPVVRQGGEWRHLYEVAGVASALHLAEV